MESGTEHKSLSSVVVTSSMNRTYSEQEVFLVIWQSWKPEEDHPEEAIIWGIYGNEMDSREALAQAESLQKTNTYLQRGAFHWFRVSRFNRGPDWDELLLDFDVLQCSVCKKGFEPESNIPYTSDWKCPECSNPENPS